jgi:hypothetical protein
MSPTRTDRRRKAQVVGSGPEGPFPATETCRDWLPLGVRAEAFFYFGTYEIDECLPAT